MPRFSFLVHVITRLWLAFALALTSALLSAPLAHAQVFTIDTSSASPLTGLWWNPNESGWGATITQQSGRMFVTMFVYDSAANPIWYTVSCAVTAASCTGEMNRVRGGSTPTATWNGSGIGATIVGNMTLTFTSNDRGVMAYTLNGLSSSKQIERQIFGPPPPPAPNLAGTWYGAIIELRSNCTQSPNNGGRVTWGQYDITLGSGASGAFTLLLGGITGLQCTYSGNFATNGARLSANGTLSCNDGRRGTWQSTNTLVTAKAMSLELAVQLDTTETCTIASTLGGSRP